MKCLIKVFKTLLLTIEVMDNKLFFKCSEPFCEYILLLLILIYYQ